MYLLGGGRRQTTDFSTLSLLKERCAGRDWGSAEGRYPPLTHPLLRKSIRSFSATFPLSFSYTPRNEQMPTPPFSMSLGARSAWPRSSPSALRARGGDRGKDAQLPLRLDVPDVLSTPRLGGTSHPRGVPSLRDAKSLPLQVSLAGCDAQKGNSPSILAPLHAGDGHRGSSLPG